MAAAALAKIFGTGKKGEPPSPQQAIQKLRETEEMLSKKSEFLEKKIEKEMQAVRKNGMKNKRGERGRRGGLYEEGEGERESGGCLDTM